MPDSTKAKKDAPNILVIQADQLTPGVLPAYGHPLVKTPKILGGGGQLRRLHCIYIYILGYSR